MTFQLNWLRVGPGGARRAAESTKRLVRSAIAKMCSWITSRYRAITYWVKQSLKAQRASIAMEEAFYSTLAQITTGTLAVFASLLITYSVYVAARRAQFDDVIQQDRIDIATTLHDLRQKRFLDSKMPDFAELYQQALNASDRQSYPPKFRNIDESRDTVQIAYDLSFELQCILSPSPCADTAHNPELAALYRTVAQLQASGFLQGPWRGRLYLWTLEQLAEEITGGDVNENAGFAPPNTPIDQEHDAWIAQLAFPINSHGPGFAEWRYSFDYATSTLDLMRAKEAQFIVDYRAFCHLRQSFDPDCGQGTLANIKFVISSIESVRSKLRDIDIETQMRDRYTLANINKTRIVSLVGIALCMGVFVPLGLLASQSGFKISRLMLILVACGSVGASFWEFGRNLLPSKSIEDKQLYLAARWYMPMEDWILNQTQLSDMDGELRTEMFAEASNSADIPLELASTISAYVRQAQAFNHAVGQRDNAIIEEISERLPLARKLTEDSGRLGRLVEFDHRFMPLTVLDQKGIEHMLSAHENGSVAILPGMSAYGIYISKRVPRKELKSVLEKVRLDYLNSPLYEQYRSAQQMRSRAAIAVQRSLPIPAASGSPK